MKARELIELLESCDPEDEVYIDVPGNSAAPIESFEPVEEEFDNKTVTYIILTPGE